MLLNRRILFVGGKGGVGKTSISSALAIADGRRTLLVSTDPAHNLGHLFGQSLSDTPTRLSAHVDGVEINPDKAIEAHFAAVEKQMLSMLPAHMHKPAMKHLASARHAPGSHEAALLERIAECVELGLKNYELVIFDTAPTGHTLHLLRMPEQMQTWTQQLLRSRARSEHASEVMASLVRREKPRDKDAEIRRVLLERQRKFELLRQAMEKDAGFVIVTVAEPMPMSESLELIAQLDNIGLPLDAVVINRRSPRDAGSFLARRHGLEEEEIKRLPDIPLIEVGLQPTPPQGIEGLRALDVKWPKGPGDTK